MTLIAMNVGALHKQELVSRSLPSEEAQLEVDGASNLATSLKHILIQEDTGFKLISSAIEVST